MITSWINKQQMRQSFNAAAKTYDQAAELQRQVGDLLLQKLNGLNLNNKTIMDLGSGTGYLSQCIQNHHPDNYIISVDIADNMLKISQKKHPDQMYLCSDAEHLSFSNHSVDIIISNMALHWCQNIQRTFKELYRILKPKGLFIFTALGEETLHELQYCWNTIDNDTHVNRFLKKSHMQKSLDIHFSETTLNTRIITRHHESIYTLMKKLKAIGAHNVTTKKPSGLTGKRKLQALEIAYESFRDETEYLPATYEVIFGVCKK